MAELAKDVVESKTVKELMEKRKAKKSNDGSAQGNAFYKKWWFWVIAVVLVIMVAAAAGGGKEEGEPTGETENTDDPLATIMSKPYERDSEEYKLSNVIYSRLRDNSSQYSDVVIDSITVNENAGTPDIDNDYIVLVNLTWNRMNSEENTKKMMRLYCDDLAAYTVEQNKHVQEITMFWTIPYQKENTVSAKCAYEQKNGGMYLSDKMGLVGD